MSDDQEAEAEVEADAYQLERDLQQAREFVMVTTAGCALLRTDAMWHLVNLFRRSSYVPSSSRQQRVSSGRNSMYRELKDEDLVDHAFWMARHFYPHDMELTRLYVMISLKIFFLTVKSNVRPKALEPLCAAAAAAQPAPLVDATPIDDVKEFSDDDADDDAHDAAHDGGGSPVTTEAAAPPRFTVGPEAAWVQIHRPSGKTQHKKERGVPSLTMRHPGFYDLDTLPLNWPRAVDAAYLHDNDVMALLVLSPTAHGALRFRPGQEAASLDAIGPSARFVYERAAWPVFVGGGGGRAIYMPTDAVVIEAEKVRLLHHTAGGLNTKEVNAYWPAGAKSVDEFNAAQRPDGSRLWLVSAQSLCRNQRLSQRALKLPKGAAAAAAAEPGASAWYMPVTDRLKVMQARILWTSPSLLYDLARRQETLNTQVAIQKYT